MGCCGQKRAMLRSTPSPTTTPAVTRRVHNTPQLPSTVQQTARWNAFPYSSTSSAVTQTTAQQASGWTAASYPAVTLRYLENSPIRVPGPVTGRQYEFSGARPVQAVDRRDAVALLRTRFFRQNY